MTGPRRPAGEGGPDGASRDVDDFLAWLMVRVGWGVEQVLGGSIGSHGLTPHQFGVLSLVDAYDDLSQADVARAVFIQPQSASTLIEQMCARGLLDRSGGGGRGRRTTLRLTTAGARLLAESWSAVVADNDAARFGLTAREAASLRRLLVKVSGSVGHPGTVRRPPTSDAR